MTTIAANREMMAADSRAATEQGLVVSSSEEKLKRLAGDLVACEGASDDCVRFEQWYEAGHDERELPEIEDDFGALVLTANGRLVRYYKSCVAVEANEPFWALGSGEEIAMGAMAAGASPKEAVEIACRLNVWTGPPVVVESIRP